MSNEPTIQTIRHRYTRKALYECEATTLREAVERAVREGVPLECASLRYTDLRYTDLRDANFRYANLRYTDLRYSDLRGSSLRCADLWSADFQYSSLRCARLWGARLSWSDHTLLSEILWRAADTRERQMLAAWIGQGWREGLCWSDYETMEHPEREWAIRTLAEWVQPGDRAPEWIRATAQETDDE